ncbi:MAG TPA: hypothetical protein ENK81_03505, partial [Euryarchaeota archaeon]|nr:hypothetical protein [Euryarchaeota archaeon]
MQSYALLREFAMSLRMFLKKVIDCCGVVEWWPSTDPFEISIQAILTQNTSWKNVLKATENLRSKGLMSPKSLFESDIGEIEKAIRPSGFYRVKAKRIKFIAKHVALHGMPKKFEDLMKLPGVGRKTANCVLAYCYGVPAIPVDTHVHRIS